MIRFYILAGRIVMLLEHLARMLWRCFTVAALFATLAAFDVLPLLPPWIHAAIICAFAVAFGVALRRGWSRHSFPSRSAALRRLEHDSALPHRPMDVPGDRPADAGTVTNLLWAVHQARARARLNHLRLRWPHAHIASHDTRAWRGLAILLLAVGLFVAGDRFPDRLDAALSPRVLGAMPARDITVDLWITPPVFTGQPAVVLSRASADDETIEVPAGSRIEARVSGGSARPHIVVNGIRTKFQAIDRHNFQITTGLAGGDDIRVTQGWRTLGRWPVSVTEIARPVIEWQHAPAPDSHEQLKLDYTAADAYGLTSGHGAGGTFRAGEKADAAAGHGTRHAGCGIVSRKTCPTCRRIPNRSKAASPRIGPPIPGRASP